mmetsp:Transcript_7041/g.11631  ORF Transcript_7041/g.11631 Transcript_7041/m.11631 type:complete len:468 (+) Transcript_7041:94-1497(+)|eukprot:CAMPEP_0197022036 /NCGR_PEP_ID=MMETSP1384-20130603/2943_1 /TAXON_ID=29189 /ORGANISM="Ammonia sp." /LENGTH=467 /DNA_ID=CAMNT_0042449999 /DNA_START=71 /DNA_END=1474 /DNA_ORIENTATION=+
MGACFTRERGERIPAEPLEDHHALSKEDKEARARRASKRQAAVKELIETEKTYVNGLEQCIKAYYDNLSQDPKIISAEDLRGIFNDIKTIHQLNFTFLNDLQAVYKNFNNDKTQIGDQFVKFCPYFKMYQNYCNNYDNAMVLLNRYNEKKAFADFCVEIRSQCQNKTLQSLLILPIQRLPRYKLCLTEIVKNTEKEHPDIVNLQRALELVEETTTLINERMKEFEARQQVRAIETRFSNRPDLVRPHRKFIREGFMTKVDKTGKDREYTFFLFNDMVCYASGESKSKSSALKMHQQLPVDSAFFIQDVPHHDKYSDRSFEVHSSVKSFIVHCTEYKVKREWMSDLSKVVKDRVTLQPGKTQQRELAAPLMVPDDWSDECQMKDCDTKFTFVNRRHHCRYCGKLICGKCGKYKLASRTNKDRVVKPVCKACFAAFSAIRPAKSNAKLEDEEQDDDDSYSDEDEHKSKK